MIRSQGTGERHMFGYGRFRELGKIITIHAIEKILNDGGIDIRQDFLQCREVGRRVHRDAVYRKVVAL